MIQKIAVAGLGLIGGSFAKALKKYTPYAVIGFDRCKTVLETALADEAIDIPGTSTALRDADMLILCLYPESATVFAQEMFSFCKPGCIVVDLCGVKSYVCARLTPLAQEHRLVFIGGHPMAGREFSGYAHSLPDLFAHGSMIFTPTDTSTPQAMEEVRALFSTLGFAQIITTTPENHDRMIAFTSQLAHVVSSAYIKSPEALHQHGYSAGSYKDLTRVAKLNEEMWAELFLKNRLPLLQEIDTLIAHLQEYRNAIDEENNALLRDLLREGRERKEQIG